MITPNVELYCLIGLALLSVPLAHLPAVARMRVAGVAWGVSNRAAPLPNVPDWVSRADRAHRNLVDNLPSYAVALLAVLISGRCDAITRGAALALVAARLLHAALYIGGVTFLGLRSGAYFAALCAALVILSRLL